MKKLVPNPPGKVISQPFYTINKYMPSPEALLYVAPLLRRIENALDEYICGNADESGVGMHNFRWCGRYAGGGVKDFK